MKLQDLLSQFETALARGESVTAEHICREHPELLDQFRQHARAIQGIEPPSENVLASTSSSTFAEESASRYTVLKAHARGGLGEVYLAHDESLGRDVALKVMLGSGADERRRRFEREAAITGRLQHPGIVPIYGTGVDDRGRPCHIMRFVSGPTLAEAIEEFQKAKPALTRTNLRPLLSRLVQVAQTVAFAHSRGVVHRDLKPSNIILGDYGETLVVDWGLAREMRNAECGTRNEDSAIPHSEFRIPQFTEDGAIVGTPVYLSPEQARGEEVTPASDVFALGGLLYAMLTGVAPYSGSSAVELMQRSPEAAVPTLASRAVAAPPALDAICFKAMAKAPADRFPDALAFAAEIDRWLADEPVACAPSPVGERLRRWTRRHRLLVSSSLAALVVAAVGLAIAAGLLSSKNEDLRSAVRLAETNESAATANAARAQDATALALKREAEATANFKTACDAVDKFTMKVNDDPRLSQLDLEKLKKDLLGSAAVFYRQLAERRGDDLTLQNLIVNAHAKLALITLESGDRNGAEREYRTAIERLQAIPGEPDRDRLRQESNLWFGVVQVLRMKNEMGEAVTAMRHAYKTRVRAFGEAGLQNSNDRFEMASMEQELGNTLAYAFGESAEVSDAFDRAEALGRRIFTDAPEQGMFWIVVPQVLKERGLMKMRTGDEKLAEKSLLEAMAFTRALPLKDDAVSDAVKQNAIQVLQNLVHIYQKQKRVAEAEAVIEEGHRLSVEYLAKHPTNMFLRSNLATSLFHRGNLRLQAGDFPKAESHLRESLELRKPIVDASPELIYERHALMNTGTQLSRALLGQKQTAESIGLLKFVATFLKDDPSDVPIRQPLIVGWARVGMAATDAKEIETAFEHGLNLTVPLASASTKASGLLMLQQLAKAGCFKDAKRAARLQGTEFAAFKDLPEFQALLKK